MMNLNNGNVPTPPPAPETVVKGYHSDGYSDLINSLSYDDRIIALNELTKPEVIRRAAQLKAQLANNELTVAIRICQGQFPSINITAYYFLMKN